MGGVAKHMVRVPKDWMPDSFEKISNIDGIRNYLAKFNQIFGKYEK